MPKRIKSIRYYGGDSHDKSGKWIASKLLFDKRSIYIETHCGMLGALMLRPRANAELVNDLNHRVMNFWHVMQTEKDALIERVHYTPHARTQFDECLKSIDEGDALERAWKFFVVITQSLMSSDSPDAKWALLPEPHTRRPSPREQALSDMADRIRGVQLENRPAIRILERFADHPDTMIYVDPPYANSHNEPYPFVQYDRDETRELLLAQRGNVAVAGFDEEWDDLGWYRHEREKAVNVSVARTRRLHVLWTNYEVQGRLM